jgi:hypothetical protein
MKSIKYLAAAVLLLTPALTWQPSAYGQYRNNRTGELNNIANNLANRADRLYERLDRRQNQGINSDLENALRNFARNARNFASRASDYQRDNYRTGARQLIREAENIARLVDRSDVRNPIRNQWENVENQVSRLADYYGLPFSADRGYARTDPYYRNDGRYGRNDDRYGWGGYGRDSGNYQSGTFRWQGRVDGADYIYLRGNRVDIRHLRSQPITNASHDMSAPLPRANVNVQLRKLDGRGRVQIIQQPSASNNYTVGVLVEDEDGGADNYAFELTW